MTKPKAHFLHIGKTGGTAVKLALEPHLLAGKYEIVLEHHHTRLSDVPAGEAVFFVLRHPLTRFVSAFNYRQRRALPREHWPWTPQEAEAFACFQNANELAEALSDADDLWRQMAQQAMRSIEHVRDSFWTWLHNPTYFAYRRADVLFVGFQESLNADFQQMLYVLGLDAQIALPADPTVANRAPSVAKAPLSELGRRNLLIHYAADVQLYEAMQAQGAF